MAPTDDLFTTFGLVFIFVFAFGFVFVFVFEFVSVFLCLVESHFSLLIVKSLSGNQSGVAAFLVVSRHNLNISRFDLDHNLSNICFKYNRPNITLCSFQQYNFSMINDNDEWFKNMIPTCPILLSADLAKYVMGY